MYLFFKIIHSIKNFLTFKPLYYRYGGSSLGGERLVATSRPQPYQCKGTGRKVLPPTTGIQHLVNGWSILVLLGEINFKLPQTYLKFYRFKRGQGGCLSRERWRGGRRGRGLEGDPIKRGSCLDSNFQNKFDGYQRVDDRKSLSIRRGSCLDFNFQNKVDDCQERYNPKERSIRSKNYMKIILIMRKRITFLTGKNLEKLKNMYFFFSSHHFVFPIFSLNKKDWALLNFLKGIRYG
ncbi:MAG: hypothetical protein HEEMFOPI_00653 [Holosporales bacterium]